MITRIELTNFMSHAHTVIEPAPGLTVLVGPNNCGKSAVVTALQVLCQNETATYVLRHGERECSVKVVTDDGHTIEWRRKNSPSYLIDGKLFDRLGRSGVPDELHQVLRLPQVDGAEGADFDVHFAAQKAPIFLLGSDHKSAAHAARFFASTSDAIRLVQMQRRHRQKLDERHREKNRLEAESKQLNAKLETLQNVPELDRRLQAAESLQDELAAISQRIDAAERDAAALNVQHAAQLQCHARSASLAALAPPQEQAPTAPVAELIQKLGRAAQARNSAAVRCQSLQPLPQPPALADTRAVTRLADELAAQERAIAENRQRSRALTILAAPPMMEDTAALSQHLTRLTTAQAAAVECRACQSALGGLCETPLPQETAPLAGALRELQSAATWREQCAAALATVQEELEAAADALRELAATSVCPTCGGPFDPERLLAGAGSGEHKHD